MARRIKLTDKLISSEENITNRQNFTTLLPAFHLNDETTKKVIEGFTTEHEIDKMFSLDENKRIWFKLTSKESALGGGYKVYKTLIRPRLRYSTLADQLLDIKTYQSGYIIINNNKIKLFKYLLSQDYLSSRELDILNQQRLPQGNIYFCISRNPIDFFFCSTDQNYSSCQSLNSGAMGLGSLTLDPNRVLLFLTTGEKRTFEVNNIPFIHFRYLQRSWGLLFEGVTKKKIAVIRYYPSMRLSFSDIKIGRAVKNINFTGTRIPKATKSIFEFEIPRGGRGCPSFIYLDFIGLLYNCETKKYFYQKEKGQTGSFCGYASYDFLNHESSSVDRCTGCIICNSCLGVTKYNYSPGWGTPSRITLHRYTYKLCNQHKSQRYFCRKCNSAYTLPTSIGNDICPFCTPMEEFKNAITV